MLKHEFTGPPFTIGVEEELMIIDPDGFDLAQRIEDVLDAVPESLAGQVKPTYPTEVPRRPMNVVEKIIAQQVFRGVGAAKGIGAVAPGDQVLCEAGFRGVHEYTGGMVMSLYGEEWGQTPVVKPELVAAFEDHFVLIDQPSVPAKVKSQRLASSQQLTAEMVSAWPLKFG